MKKTLFALLLAGTASLVAAQENTESIESNCTGGGQKSIVYDWNIYSGAITYTATLTDCKPDSAGDRNFNGTISGNGTLLLTAGGFNVNMTIQEALSVTGVDTGSISCESGLQGDFTTATAAFSGTLSKTNCTYTVNASGVNLVELLTAISFD